MARKGSKLHLGSPQIDSLMIDACSVLSWQSTPLPPFLTVSISFFLVGWMRSIKESSVTAVSHSTC